MRIDCECGGDFIPCYDISEFVNKKLIKTQTKLIIDNEEIELTEIFKFGKDRNQFNKSYDIKFYDCKNKVIRRFKIK